MTYQDARQAFDDALTRLVSPDRHAAPADAQDLQQQLREAALELSRLQILVIPDYLAARLPLSSIRAIWPEQAQELPADTEVIDWHHDWLRGAHQVKVWSAHFPPVPESSSPPLIHLPLAAAWKPARTSAADVMWLMKTMRGTSRSAGHANELEPAAIKALSQRADGRHLALHGAPPSPTHTAPEARASPPATTPASLAPTHSRDDQED